MSKKVLAVIRREFVTRAKTKGFIIGTLIFPLLLVFIFGGMFLLGSLFKPSTKDYVIVDQSGIVYEAFVSAQADTMKNGMPKYRFEKQALLPGGFDETIEMLGQRVRDQEVEGYLVIPEDIVDSREVRYSARNVSDFDEQRSFSRSLSWIVTNHRLENIGMSSEKIRHEMAQGHVRLSSRQVTDEGEVEKSGGASFILTYLLTYVLLLMMMIYGQMTMRSVIEEKSQRITETIVSSIKPIELMVGKMVGICALGLTQLLIFGGFVYLSVAYAVPVFTKFGVNVPELFEVLQQLSFSASMFGFMILFFLLGFIFFSGLFAAIGAMVNSEDEGQQFQLPITLLIMTGYFMVMSVAKNPDTTRAFWVSLVPFWTPIVMFCRIAVSDPILPSGAWLSVFTMIAFTFGLIVLVAKIYRVGILMYGKKPSLKEAIKWIRYK